MDTRSSSGDFLFFPSKKIFLFACAALLLVGILFYERYIAAPTDFPANQIITVGQGEALSQEAVALEQAHIITSGFFFKAFLIIFHGSHGLVAGQYKFAKSYGAATIAWRLSHGIYGLKQVTLTVPEGTNIFQLAALVSKDFPDISASDFLAQAIPYDGYLFPDTYFLTENSSSSDIISIMRKTFDSRIELLTPDVASFGKPINDVITVASILEKEAATDEDRKIIAGIIWKRLSKNIPLQVDAAFAYVPGIKDIADLSSGDLAIDNPYNTYLHTGLPPTPISNPGLASIEDALHPTATAYYYYVSDANGVIHYAVTNDEQNDNRAKYLGQ